MLAVRPGLGQDGAHGPDPAPRMSDAPSRPGAAPAAAVPRPGRALVGITAALTIFAVAQGLSYPLFTFLMQRQGLGPGEIGLSAAMMPVGIVLSAPLVPRAARLLGPRALGTGAALVAALAVLVAALRQDWVAWYPARLVIGICLNPLYILSEVWLLRLAPPARRGRIIGIFNSVMGAGFAAGPLVLALAGSGGPLPFAVAVGGFVLCGACLLATTGGLGGFEAEGGRAEGVLGFWLVAPALLLAVTVAAANSQAFYALMPVFGAAHGLPEPVLAAMLTVLGLGNIALQIPLGLAAERAGARAMILGCAAATFAGALLLAALVGTPGMWPVLFLLGGAGYGLYVMAVVELGNRFSGQRLVAGNAAFALMWGAGGVIGPPGAGVLAGLLGPAALPLVVAGLSALLLAVAGLRAATRRDPR